ncbi:hypothetical protein SSX86_018407 [Deinandra increscens subsp. villosa]|uniref:DUF7653 domain-containing protein n=1 Tax=Deinandra increscens subsp. villosa TaxID=3103831 RepID=A0AAP0GUN0_9ASTR
MKKKLLFFMSSTSSNGSNKLAPSPSKAKHFNSENSSSDGLQAARKSISEKLCIKFNKVMHSGQQVKDLQSVSDVKVQVDKMGAESLTRSLQDCKCSEGVVESDSKAEALRTLLAREKLSPKEVDIESEDSDGITLLKAGSDLETRKQENETNRLQMTLEKELARRSTEWSMKLEKYKREEHRLRERVRELAEQNVSLQRKVSLLGEKELDNQSKVRHSGQQVKDLTVKMEEVVKDKENLHQNLTELEEKHRAAEEDRDLFKRNFEAKDKECKELRKAVTRLLRASNEQDKTIEGLREGFGKEVRNFNQNQQSKMQVEQLRLSGVEQSLRKEVESYRLEVDSLRHENINLLHRLKGSSKDGSFSTFKLNQELWSRVHCLQNQGMRLINDSVHLCSKLIENVKEKGLKTGLESQFIMESDTKVQGFRRGADNLTRSLQNVSNVLQEKSTPDNECSKDVVKSDFKSEALMTSLLKEKLYSKEVEAERLEAELATAVRGHDVLRCELQNAMDNLSCITHKMKNLEMEVIKKDENIYHLQISLQDCKKDLSIVNRILPKVSEERDFLWENVKQHSENNMLLNAENAMLKKRVEGLDEDVLFKEGQITILKDALKKPFDLLSSPIPAVDGVVNFKFPEVGRLLLRRTVLRFQGHAAMRPSLDPVEPKDQLTHQLSLHNDPDTKLNVFKVDPNLTENEKQYNDLKKTILDYKEDYESSLEENITIRRKSLDEDKR